MTVEVGAHASDKLIGEVLANRYQIEQRLGEGAMGAVYRAKHVKVGRAFAVKVLHPHLLLDAKIQQRFEREAELAGRLRHPNVIGVVDVGETPDGMRYMVMDFAAGPDLAALMSEAPMPPPRVIHLVRQLLEGLYHAHEAGLIHRDFKPENVIVERDTHGAEVPRIVDFGIAILREGGESTDGPGRLTTNGLVLGTPHYMAPEQAIADPIDHRIDLFALGIMIYEMLSGKLPFDGGGAEVARANLMLDPPPISERVPFLEVDPLLEAFARRLMAKRRDQRPATAKAARDLLDLIERDREAAASALGVPASAARAPITTQDSAPLRHPGDHEGTFPPPIATPAEPTPRPDFPTQTTDQIRKRKPPLAAIALIGLGVLGGGTAVVLGTKKNSTPKAQPQDTIAQTTPGSATQPMPIPTPVQVPAPTAPPIEAQPTEPSPEPSTETAETKPPPAVVDKRPVKTGTATKKTTTKAPAKTENVTPPVVTPPVVTRPVETKPVQTKPVDAMGIANQYKSVGAQLKELQDAKGADAASDLWARYRLIRLVDAMSSQPKRDEAATLLSKLSTEIAARKR
ncbi:MAG TPA: protein kinase [Kofleriaceae bacterium]|nr:protein kinase [Kofleriaceae bacterium]